MLSTCEFVADDSCELTPGRKIRRNCSSVAPNEASINYKGEEISLGNMSGFKKDPTYIKTFQRENAVQYKKLDKLHYNTNAQVGVKFVHSTDSFHRDICLILSKIINRR